MSNLPRKRAEIRRALRLAEISEQVAAGRLVIRQATPEERERYGIKPDVDENHEDACR